MQGTVSVINRLGNTLDQLEAQLSALSQQLDEERRRRTDLEVELAHAQTALEARTRKKTAG